MGIVVLDLREWQFLRSMPVLLLLRLDHPRLLLHLYDFEVAAATQSSCKQVVGAIEAIQLVYVFTYLFLHVVLDVYILH